MISKNNSYKNTFFYKMFLLYFIFNMYLKKAYNLREMKDEVFKNNAIRVKQVMSLYLKEGIDLPSIIILTEIVVSKMEKRALPNIKWVETEFQISFTKVNAILQDLVDRNFIIKVPSQIDARVKYLDITKSGKEFIYEITGNLVRA